MSTASDTTNAGVAEPIADLAVPLEQLRHYPRNPRRGDVDAIKRSLERNGQYRPIVVNRRTGEVLAGNHTVKAARDLGWQSVAATYVDVDDEQAARIALADNRTADLAVYDDAELVALLQSLDDLDGTAWRDDELTALLEQLDAESVDDDDEQEPQRLTFDVYSREQLIDAAFAHYRATGFPYRQLPLFSCLLEINKLAALSDDALENTILGYGVADTYHPHRWHVEVEGKRTAIDTFESDKYLRVALEHVFDYGVHLSPQSFANTLALTRNAQAAANFRPGYALSLLRRYAPSGASVLDSSAGFGGRLVGFIASQCERYVGVDPARQTHEANQRLAADLCPASKRVELHCAPAEDMPCDEIGSCDVALTSPPYFAKERYSDEPTQSFARYPTATDWRDGFLLPMLRLQHAVLADGAYNLLNVADVTIKGETVPLVEWSLAGARDSGFEIVTVERYALHQHFGRGVDERIDESGVAGESVIVMRK